MTREEALDLSGHELFSKGLKAVKEGKMTMIDFGQLCNEWTEKRVSKKPLTRSML